MDDHPLFAEGMQAMFKPGDNIEVVRHTKNGNELISILASTEVDVILMDIDMPIIDGITTIELLKEHDIDKPILMLTMHQSMKYVKKALEKGVQGYILKDASKEELVEAIKKVGRRENYFHTKISDQVFDYFRGKRKSHLDLNELSEREKEIIKCLADGLNSKEIAEKLSISRHTVKTHRRNIMHKLNVNTSTALVRLAIEKGIIQVSQF